MLNLNGNVLNSYKAVVVIVDHSNCGQKSFTFIHSCTHSYTDGSDYLAGCNLLIRIANHLHTHIGVVMVQHQEQFEVQCLGQGHFDTSYYFMVDALWDRYHYGSVSAQILS